MLHPHIEVRSKGSVHGYGLFATRSFAIGDWIWKMNDKVHTLEQVQSFSGEQLRKFNRYGYQYDVDSFVLPECEAREMNHSCDPNTWSRGQDTLVARRAIQADDEITYDYSTYDIAIPFELECRCGADNCRRIVSHLDYLDTAWQAQYGENLPPHVIIAIEQSKTRNRS